MGSEREDERRVTLADTIHTQQDSETRSHIMYFSDSQIQLFVKMQSRTCHPHLFRFVSQLLGILPHLTLLFVMTFMIFFIMSEI